MLFCKLGGWGVLSKMPLYPLPLVPSGCAGRQAHEQCPFTLTCRPSEKSYGGRSVSTLGKEGQCENGAECGSGSGRVPAASFRKRVRTLWSPLLSLSLFLCHNRCCQVPHVGDIDLNLAPPPHTWPRSSSAACCRMAQWAIVYSKCPQPRDFRKLKPSHQFFIVHFQICWQVLPQPLASTFLVVCAYFG